MTLFTHNGFNWLAAALLSLACSSAIQAQPLALSNIPLSAASGNVDPNVMLLFDTSGSMNQVVSEGPGYISGENYGGCETGIAAPTNGVVFIQREANGNTFFNVNGVSYDWGRGSSATNGRLKRCFVVGTTLFRSMQNQKVIV